MVGFDDCVDKTQTQTGPTQCSTLVTAKKTLKYPLLIFGCDARAIVRHCQQAGAGPFVYAYTDTVTAGPVLDGIVYKVGCDALQHGIIATNPTRRFGLAQ